MKLPRHPAFLPEMFLGLLGLICTSPLSAWSDPPAQQQKPLWHCPHPAYPDAARATRAAGMTKVTFTTGPTGRISQVTVIKSSGSQILDLYTQGFIIACWKGPPDCTHTTAFDYRSPRASSASAQTPPWVAPRPGYPVAARNAHITGKLTFEVSTDARGKILSVSITKSSGSDILDRYMEAYVRDQWSGPPNTRRTFSLEYRLPPPPSPAPSPKPPA